MIATRKTMAKLNEVGPYAYLKDVIERMSNGHPMNRPDELVHFDWRDDADRKQILIQKADET